MLAIIVPAKSLFSVQWLCQEKWDTVYCCFSNCSLYRKTSDSYEKLRVSSRLLHFPYIRVIAIIVNSWYLAVLQKLEGRVASDEDLKLSDLLRYYDRDSQAALVS